MATPVANGSFVSGLFRVFEAGERLLVEQAELLRLDSREKLGSFAARFGVGALGARLALAALAQLALGIGLIAAARRREKGEDGDA